MRILIGNIIALIASLIMVASSYVKDKKNSLYVGSIQLMFNAIAGFVLEAYSAVVVNLIGIPRNLLAARGSLTVVDKVVIVGMSTGCSVLFNQHGALGLLPVISAIVYTLLLDRVKPLAYKALTIFTLVLWAIYDCITFNFVSMAFDIASLIAATIAIVRIKRDVTVT